MLFAVACAGCDGCSLFGPSDCGKLIVDRYFVEDLFDPSAYTQVTVDGVAHFKWSHEFSDLCVAASDAANLAEMEWTYPPAPSLIQPPAGLRFQGFVYHAAGFQPYSSAPVAPGGGLQGGPFSLKVENIGLKQGNELVSTAFVIAEFDMSLTSFGSPEEDRFKARNVITSLKFYMHHREVK